jgi:hypothetical protein
MRGGGWSASIRVTFKTGPVPTEWHGDRAEWALSYSVEPALNDALRVIKSAGVLVVDVSVTPLRRKGPL